MATLRPQNSALATELTALGVLRLATDNVTILDGFGNSVSSGGSLGSFANTAALQTAFPAATNTGKTALVAGVLYYSDGTNWTPLALAGPIVATPVNSQQVNGFKDDVTVPLGTTTYTGALIVGRDVVATVTGTTGKTTSGGHIIGLQSGVIVNTGTVTHDLVIGQETQLQNLGAGTTITLAALHVAHLKNFAGSAVLATAYRPVLASGDVTGSISIWGDYYSEDWTAVTGAPATRFSMLADDPNKQLLHRGRIMQKDANATAANQEYAPAIGAGYQAARYYWGSNPAGSLNPTPLIANFAFFAPLRIKRRVTLTEIGCTVTAAVAATNVQLAIWKVTDGVLYGTGAAPLYASGNLSSATTGDKTTNPAITLDAGNYIVGVNSGGTPTINFSPENGLAQYFGATTSTGRETTPCASLTFGTWGIPTLAFAEVGQAVPHIWVKGS